MVARKRKPTSRRGAVPPYPVPKRPPKPTPLQRLPLVAPVIEQQPAPGTGKDPWFRSILTDHAGDFDLGAVLVGIVVCFMCLAAGYDAMVLGKTFDAERFGIGVASVLAGFAAYKWGDAKRAPSSTTTIQATQTTTTADPTGGRP